VLGKSGVGKEQRVKLKMAENSLFAILLRSSWWISVAIAAGIVVVAGALLPTDYRIFGPFTALPFAVIAAVAGWRQFKAPSPARIEQTVETLRTLTWPILCEELEAALRRDGWVVAPVKTPGADFALSRGGRRSLLACKRWKVARTGVEPLRELRAAMDADDAHTGIYVSVGEVTDKARQYAAANEISLMQGPALAALMPGLGRQRASRGS